MEKLRNGRFTHQIATNDEVASYVVEADAMIRKYGWQDRTVSPYGYQEKVTRISDQIRDYPHCSFGSKQYLIDLANGLTDILNEWERQELEPKITVRIIRNGKTAKIGEELARELIEDGVAEVV